MFNELDSVVLNRNIPDYALKEGDIGSIVHKYADAGIFEVEFVAAGGDTIALIELSEKDIRHFLDEEIIHARKIYKEAS